MRQNPLALLLACSVAITSCKSLPKDAHQLPVRNSEKFKAEGAWIVANFFHNDVILLDSDSAQGMIDKRLKGRLMVRKPEFNLKKNTGSAQQSKSNDKTTRSESMMHRRPDNGPQDSNQQQDTRQQGALPPQAEPQPENNTDSKVTNMTLRQAEIFLASNPQKRFILREKESPTGKGIVISVHMAPGRFGHYFFSATGDGYLVKGNTVQVADLAKVGEQIASSVSRVRSDLNPRWHETLGSIPREAEGTVELKNGPNTSFVTSIEGGVAIGLQHVGPDTYTITDLSQDIVARILAGKPGAYILSRGTGFHKLAIHDFDGTIKSVAGFPGGPFMTLPDGTIMASLEELNQKLHDLGFINVSEYRGSESILVEKAAEYDIVVDDELMFRLNKPIDDKVKIIFAQVNSGRLGTVYQTDHPNGVATSATSDTIAFMSLDHYMVPDHIKHAAPGIIDNDADAFLFDSKIYFPISVENGIFTAKVFDLSLLGPEGLHDILAFDVHLQQPDFKTAPTGRPDEIKSLRAALQNEFTGHNIDELFSQETIGEDEVFSIRMGQDVLKDYRNTNEILMQAISPQAEILVKQALDYFSTNKFERKTSRAALDERSFLSRALDGHGVAIGELHNEEAARQYLIEHMKEIASKKGVLCLEHLLYSRHQKLLDQYLKSKAKAPMPKRLQNYLDELDASFHATRTWGYKSLVNAAKKAGVRIIAMDTMASYVAGFSPRLGSTGSERIVAGNYVFDRILTQELKDGEKPVILTGLDHLLQSPEAKVPGIAEIRDLPAVSFRTGLEGSFKAEGLWENGSKLSDIEITLPAKKSE